MTTGEISQSIQKMKIHLTKGEKIEHWVNFFFLLFPIGFIGFLTYAAATHDNKFPFLTFLIFGVFILFLRHKIISPKLEVYNSELTTEQFIQANQVAASLNDWIILSNSNDYFSAIKTTGSQWEGIKITALLKNKRLYLNSMVNPSTRSNPFTFGLNKKNKLALIGQYQSILKGENISELANIELEKREEDFWNESEWTIKNILKRIVAYGVIMIFLLIGFIGIYEGEFMGIFLSIAALGISYPYVKSDIEIVKEKNRRKQLKK